MGSIRFCILSLAGAIGNKKFQSHFYYRVSVNRCSLKGYTMDSQQQKIDLEKQLANRDGLSVGIESMVTFINLFSAIGGNLRLCSMNFILLIAYFP